MKVSSTQKIGIESLEKYGVVPRAEFGKALWSSRYKLLSVVGLSAQRGGWHG